MRFLILICLLVSVAVARAQVYSTTTNVSPTAPFVVTNAPQYAESHTLNGAYAATNAVSANSTNYNVWASLLDLRNFKRFSIEVLCNQYTNNGGFLGAWTNWIFLYPSLAAGRLDTNHPTVLGPFSPTSGFTNMVVAVEVPDTNTMTTGWFGCAVGVQGTNTITNLTVRPFVKPATYDN